MTKEEKQLLLRDLCGRLPYRVIVHIHDIADTDDYDRQLITEDLDFIELYRRICKPYLRPISSMTEEEMDRLFDILHIDKDGNGEDWIKINDTLGIKFFFPTGKWVEDVVEAYDYLNSIHIDYRGLIPMGLALEAPEGMYKTE